MAVNWDAGRGVETSAITASIATSVWTPTVPKRATNAMITTPVAATYHAGLAASAASTGNGYPLAADANTVVPVSVFADSGTETLTVKSVSGALGNVSIIFELRPGQPR